MTAERSQAHPWHGVSPGPNSPARVTAYIEIVPTDTVKYELDKASGILRVDRPQRFSNLCPALYGFVPQTYCGAEVGARCAERTGKRGIVGDGDPLDICVFSERTIGTSGFLLEAIPVGGMRMVDGNQADDKIQIPGEGTLKQVEIAELYGRDEAHEVIRRSQRDYRAAFGTG